MAMASGIDIRFHSAEYRQCTIDGKRALFHRWVEKDELLLNFNTFVKPDRMVKFTETYKENGYLPNGVELERIRTLVALVEFEDGTMKEVEALSVRFLDGREKFDTVRWEV